MTTNTFLRERNEEIIVSHALKENKCRIREWNEDGRKVLISFRGNYNFVEESFTFPGHLNNKNMIG